MRLSALIVNWNTRDDLRDCLLSLVTNPFTLGTQEIVVVDNASQDGSVEMVRTEFPAVQILVNTTNDIYAAATNQALEAATGDFLVFLNPDAQVQKGALDALTREVMAHSKTGAVAGRLVHENGVTQSSIRGFPEPLPLLYDILGLARLVSGDSRLGAYRQRFFDYSKPGLAPQPMTSCLLISRACYQAVGGMDERFPLYFNDVDWCFRCWKAGFEIRYTPDAVVLHGGGGTTKKVRKAAVWESHRALLRFYAKHYKKHTPFLLYGLITLLVKLGAWVRTGRWGQSLGKEGGETTPEQLRQDMKRAT